MYGGGPASGVATRCCSTSTLAGVDRLQLAAASAMSKLIIPVNIRGRRIGTRITHLATAVHMVGCFYFTSVSIHGKIRSFARVPYLSPPFGCS